MRVSDQSGEQQMSHSCNQPAGQQQQDYAEQSVPVGYASAGLKQRCGINRHSALCVLCRYRHNGHWTGAPHRIDRTFGKRFGDADYAFEELVAELGAAFLCSAFRIVNEPRADHAAYISGWLNILDRDHKAIFTAARMAQEAAEYLTMLAASSR